MSYLSRLLAIFSTISRLQPLESRAARLLKLTAKEGTVTSSNPGLSLKDGRYKVSRMLGLANSHLFLWFETMESKMTSWYSLP